MTSTVRLSATPCLTSTTRLVTHRERAAGIVERIAVLTGPHFRYEEESLYPALSRFGDRTSSRS
ncbi:MAG: hypothetical protein R3A49_09520 [Acidimicrobiia bacterium]